MKHIKVLILSIVISLLSLPSWGEVVSSTDIVWRDYLWYEKFSDTPFTGTVTGELQGKIENGKIEGAFTFFFDTGQLDYKGIYKDKEKEGVWSYYHRNGRLKRIETYKDGSSNGPLKSYYKKGNLQSEGNYKDGTREGVWSFYNENGRLEYKGSYKDGKKDGVWKQWDLLFWRVSETTYEKGVKINDPNDIVVGKDDKVIGNSFSD